MKTNDWVLDQAKAGQDSLFRVLRAVSSRMRGVGYCQVSSRGLGLLRSQFFFRTRNGTKSGLAGLNRTANLSGLVLGFIGADF